MWCQTKPRTEAWAVPCPVFWRSALAPNLCVSFLKFPLLFLAHTMPSFICCSYLLLGGGWEWGCFEGACEVQFQAGREQFTHRYRVSSCGTSDPIPMQTQRSVWAKWCPPTLEVLQLTLSSVLLLQHSGGSILPLPEVRTWAAVKAETVMEI